MSPILRQLFGSKRSRQLSAASMVVQAALAGVRGERKLAAALLGAAVVAYRFSWLGLALQVGLRWYRHSR